MLRKIDGNALLVFLLLCFVAAAIGAFAVTTSVNTWYPQLEKPAYAPPNQVFGPVWTALYLMIAFSGWLLWRGRSDADIGLPLALYAVQLALNAAWSVIFFGLRQPGFAAVEIILLFAAIALYAAVSWKISRPASLLMLPYLAWVGFASVLNITIWILN